MYYKYSMYEDVDNIIDMDSFELEERNMMEEEWDIYKVLGLSRSDFM